MANLKQGTLEVLKENGKTWANVEFIQGKDFRVKDKDTFLELMNIEYNDGFGGREIPEDLTIIGDDWWLERHEYDGSEWWEYKQ